ncbi:hypothetical protein ROM21_17310 [Cronobacter sakazakii]|nr:hypothetical protein [Cronobacter sakazakii]MDT3653143.1 hypothetical protein [Cronobacter sakazakii]
MDTRQPPVRFSARLLSYLIISSAGLAAVGPGFCGGHDAHRRHVDG